MKFNGFQDVVIENEKKHEDNNEETYIPLKQDEKELENNYHISNSSLKNKIDVSKLFYQYFIKIFTCLPFIIATILYLISLQGCSSNLNNCFVNEFFKFIKWLTLIFICGALYIFQLYLYIYKITNYLPILIQTLSITYLCFIHDFSFGPYVLLKDGYGPSKHGGLNTIILIIFMILITAFVGLCILIKRCLKKNVVITLFAIFAVIALSVFGIQKILYRSCDYWTYGFKGQRLEYSEKIGCNINPPKICFNYLTDGWFDFTKIFNIQCKGINNNFSALSPYIADKTSKIIGYPRTENFKYFPDSVYGNTNKNVIKGIINMEDSKIDQSIKDKIEVTTNFYKNPPEVKIDLKYNVDLVKERKEIRNNYKHKPIAKNIITFFLDSLSRNSFKIKLPKFHAWIESFSLNKDVGKDMYNKQKLESFEFMKFHGVGRSTGLNLVPTFFGVFSIYYSGKSILKEIKNAGYIVGQSSAFCTKEIFELEIPGADEHFEYQTYDHEMISLACDPNIAPYDNPSYASSSNIRRCLYDNDWMTYPLEYMLQFFTKYKDEPKYFRLGNEDAHEGTNEVIKYIDDLLVEYFNKFEKAGFLDDTILIIHSDHGMGMTSPHLEMNFEDWDKESVLPAMYFIVPTSIERYDEIRENLKHNEQSLMTPFNIYNSFKTLVGLTEYRKSLIDKHDVFTEKLSRSRNCTVFWDPDYYDHPEDQDCRCSDKPAS